MYVFCIWLLSLSVTFVRFIHITARMSVSILFTTKYYSIVWIDHIWLIHSSVDGHVGRFQLGNNTAVYTQACLLYKVCF